MTIGAGFICRDGIVIAADTQESTGYAGYMKGEKFKIDYSQQSTWSIAIAGAGDSNYVEMCAQQILRSCAITHDSPYPRFDVIQALGMEIFSRHFLPFSGYPRDDRPIADMLIAIQEKNGRQELIEWNGTSFVSYFPFKFIGAGEQMGSHLARGFGLSTFFTNETHKVAGLAIYIISQAKATVETCGGNTDVVILRSDGKTRRIYAGEVKACEEKYRRIHLGKSHSLADRILASPPELDDV